MTAPTRKKAYKALKSLSSTAPDDADFKRFFDDLIADRNDRAVIIIAASILEEALANALKMELRTSSNEEKEVLFGVGMPLSSFSAKIKFVYALRLCDKREKNNMNVIREVRNAFAHSMKYMDFKTEEVASMCGFIETKKFKPVVETSKKLTRTPRFIYTSECMLLTNKFMKIASDQNRLLAKLLIDVET